MAAENGQLEEVRYIHCLLCNDSKPFKGFLSHIREKHVNYYRYNCAKCAFKSDNEEDSALHSFEKNHHVKFDNANYHEYLAVKIFQDCCREQFVIRHRMEKHKNFVPKPTKRRRNWNSCSDIQKVQSPKKSKLKTNNNTCTSSLLKHEVDLQAISENQRNSGITTNPRKCLNDVEKPESGIHTTKILSKAAADDSESYKLSESDGQTLCALGLFSDALENAETTSSDKLLNANTVNNVVSIDGEVSKPNRNTFDPKRRTAENSSVPLVTTLKLNTTCRKCGKPITPEKNVNWDTGSKKREYNIRSIDLCSSNSFSQTIMKVPLKFQDVGVDYIAKKTHALQFHFTQDDDPEIAELLPATVKACFPYSLSWSDYQCTECGKALGTHGSRRNHVLKEHFYWSTICPLSGCTTVISAVGNLEEHFKLEHNISMSKMPKGLRQKLIKMKNDRKNDLHRQVCFFLKPL
ncbi:unnamed protein product [Wuchereria bancrofti]|uniref:C2H2-type domain-containing protein n=1 Tax=Wuchereria bancrofti TaxID=6293 RepID=A0A3P7E5T7_WUCBA|nr:unnamed protein product [Wuchereria bancrofti]